MNISKIQDGVYGAHLIAAEAKLSASGKPLIAFQWKLDATGQTVKSFLHLTFKDGSPNLKGIALAKAWAPDWDGKDLYWFSENLALASTYAVKLTIVNEPSYLDSRNVYANVKWVNPPSRFAATEDKSRPAVAPEVELEPTMHDTWRMWSLMTEKCSLSYRDKTWLKYAREIAADKDQIDFTAEDWEKMQTLIKLTHAN